MKKEHPYWPWLGIAAIALAAILADYRAARLNAGVQKKEPCPLCAKFHRRQNEPPEPAVFRPLTVNRNE